MAANTQQQTAGASELAHLGQAVREACDQFITSIGVFRLAAHQKARRIIEGMAADGEVCSMDRRQQEAFLRRSIEQHPFFELFYVTDERGMQVSDNIGSPDFVATYGSSGRGKDWSARPWFTGAIEKDAIYISNIYRSVATERFCFTIAAPLHRDGELIGVLGADVSLSDILIT